MTDVPVFLITGFLEGGKTTFIKEIFNNPDFIKNEKILIITCESGIEHISEEFLKANNSSLININEKDKFTAEFLKQCDIQYKPTKVIIEYNGMWTYEIIEYLTLPSAWSIAQVITPIDASTFEAYMANMKSLLIEQFKDSDLIVFNRCDDNTNKLTFRSNVKAVNTKANMIFELKNGEIDDRPIELPYDINADVITFEDYDYGIWFIDVAEDPKKYEGKKVCVKGIAFNHDRYPKNVFAFGRNAMTCCADDIQFLGMLCQSEKPQSFNGKEWVEVEGILHAQFIPSQQEMVPFMTVTNVRKTEKLEDELVYF